MAGKRREANLQTTKINAKLRGGGGGGGGGRDGLTLRRGHGGGVRRRRLARPRDQDLGDALGGVVVVAALVVRTGGGVVVVIGLQVGGLCKHQRTARAHASSIHRGSRRYMHRLARMPRC